VAWLDLNVNDAGENGHWSPTAERVWIAWTAIVAILWALWYLTVPTVQSLLRFAEKIGRTP
jgi:hypothetical protein